MTERKAVAEEEPTLLGGEGLLRALPTHFDR